MRGYICRFPGCNVLIDKPGYCKKHYKPPVEKKAFGNAIRANDEMYRTYAWKKLREEVIKEHPYCCRCQGEERLTVDHIIDPRGNKELFFNKENLQVLCFWCHNLKTNEEIQERKKNKLY